MRWEVSRLQFLHYGIVIGGGALLILLTLTEKKAALHKAENASSASFAQGSGSGLNDSGIAQKPLSLAKENLPKELQKKIDFLEKATHKSDSLKILQEIIELAISQERYDVAANYQEQFFFKQSNAKDPIQDLSNLEKTARYFYQASLHSDSLESSAFQKKALKYYENYLSKKPQDLDAQVAQAILWVKEGNTPMQGIQKLVRLAEEHPYLYRAHLELGKFSLQTGQVEKAIARLEQAQKAPDADWEVFFYLGLAYAQKERWQEAKAAYTQARTMAPRAQIQLIIEEQLQSIP